MVKFLIEHPIAVTMTFVALLVVGVVTSMQLPVSLLPDTPVPKISVHISQSNLSARELENTITSPIRRYLLQTSELENISSKTYNEYAVIEMDFAYGADIDLAFLETNEKIDLALQHLPRNLQRPRVIKASATDIPAFYLNLTLKQTNTPQGNAKEISQEFIELSNFAHQVIRKRLEQTPEVALVDMSGMVFPEIIVTPEWNKLTALNISLDALEHAIKQSNISLGNLTILDGQYQYNVRFSAAINNIRDIEEIFIKVDEQVFQLKELVSVKQQPQQPQGLVLANGQQAITMAVIKRGDAQMNALKESLGSLIKNFEYDYPHIDFSITRDQTRLLEYSVSNLKQGLVWSAVLAFLVMFFFLRNTRSPVLIGISIPTALIISLFLFYLFDISINIISLSGLILGVGMMVDNSIIVIDNISQHLEMGNPLKKACIIGVNEIFRPLLSSVLTTCAVFIPLIFISGITGALFYDQAVAVTIGLFTSLAVAITILPVYFFLFYRQSGEWKIDEFLKKLSGIPFTRIYEVGFVMVMRRQVMVWGLLLLMVVLTVWLYSELPLRRLPEYEKNEILLRINWNESINLVESQRRVEEVVDQVKAHLVDYTALLGKQEFVLNQAEGKSPSEANLYLRVHSSDDIEKLTVITEQFISKHFPRAITEYKASENLFEMVFNDNQPFLVARLQPVTNFGDDESIQLNNMMTSLRNSPVGSIIAEPEWQEFISLKVDYEKLLIYDVSIQRLYAELQSALNAHTILLIADNQYSVPVVIGSEEKSFGEILMQLQIENENGDMIPFRSLVSSSRDKSLSYITAGQEGVYYPVLAELSPTEADWFMNNIRAVVQNNGLFEVDFSGSYFDTQKLMKEMAVILSISLLLLYFILAAQFESLKLPLIVLFEVPVDFFGALFFLWLFDASINIMSMIGIIVMTGIIINDSILKVDTINQLRKGGMPLITALHVAGKRRLKPILMTTITTILALVPLFFSSGMGNDIQKPFALTIIGGMTIGTLVSIYVVPMLYYNLEKNKK